MITYHIAGSGAASGNGQLILPVGDIVTIHVHLQ